MVALFVASEITTALVCVVATAITGMALKNQLLHRQQQRVRHWQERALTAERLLQGSEPDE